MCEVVRFDGEHRWKVFKGLWGQLKRFLFYKITTTHFLMVSIYCPSFPQNSMTNNSSQNEAHENRWKLNAMIQLNSEIESSLFLGARNCLSGWAVGQYYLSIPLLLVASIKLNLWSHWSVPLRTCPLLIMYSKGWPWTFGKHPAAQSCEACVQTPLLARLTGWRSEPQARLRRGDPSLNKQKYKSLFLILKSQTTYTAHTIPSKCIFI